MMMMRYEHRPSTCLLFCLVQALPEEILMVMCSASYQSLKGIHCKNWGVKMTPVGVNRGPHPRVLNLHPIDFEHNTKEC